MVSVSCLSAMLMTVVAMFLSHQVAPVDTCGCLLKHPQSIYCTTDWAIMAEVESTRLVKNPSTTYEQELRGYKVKITKVFKEGMQHLVNGSVKNLYTSPNVNSYGPSLKLKTTYYIQGMTQKGMLMFDQCDIPREWSRIPRLLKKGYTKLYQKNCVCPIETSMHKQNASDSSCTMRLSLDDNQNQCYKDHFICARGKKNSPSSSSCIWSRQRGFKNCMKSANNKSSKGRFNW